MAIPVAGAAMAGLCNIYRDAWVGTPADLIAQIESYRRAVGGFDDASL